MLSIQLVNSTGKNYSLASIKKKTFRNLILNVPNCNPFNQTSDESLQSRKGGNSSADQSLELAKYSGTIGFVIS